jgi:phage tail sheath gpL-like
LKTCIPKPATRAPLSFAKGLVVIRNAQDPSRVDVLFDPYLISGLRIFAVLNQFRLAAAA